jgi:hypothetical protein
MSEPHATPPHDRLPLSLRLDAFIEQLRADRRPHWPVHLQLSGIQLYQMAAMFCAARPGAGRPRSSFVTALRAYLMNEVVRHFM